MANDSKAQQAVTIPAVGESVSEGIIASWLVADGQTVEEGQALLELETDKATLDIPSPASGIIKIELPEGSEVIIEQQVASIEMSADSVAAATTAPQAETVVPASTATSKPAAESSVPPVASANNKPAAVPSTASAANAPESTSPLSPAVRRVVAEHNVDVANIAGSGRGGRVTKDDVLSSLKQRATAVAADQNSGGESAISKTAPVAVSDTHQHTDSTEEQRSVPLSRIRKRIAENLVQSKLQAAHLTTFNEIDMTEVMQLRATYREEFEQAHGIRLGFMSFFVKASCLAIQQFPTINAFLEDDTITYNNHCHIGVALASNKGLIVPVLRYAEEKNFAGIEREIKEFARAAQEKRLSPDALRGGTFTITNGGVFGSLLSTPIPNPPQTAILGMHAINQRPAVVEGVVMPRPLMYAALTYDHRLIDGKEAVGFLKSVKQSIEEPARLMLAL